MCVVLAYAHRGLNYREGFRHSPTPDSANAKSDIIYVLEITLGLSGLGCWVQANKYGATYVWKCASPTYTRTVRCLTYTKKHTTYQ